MSNPPPLSEGIRRLTRGASPEMRRLMLLAYEQGFEVGRTNSGHYKVMVPEDKETPDGIVTVFLPGTTSDRRSVHRCITKLKRIGVEFPKN